MGIFVPGNIVGIGNEGISNDGMGNDDIGSNGMRKEVFNVEGPNIKGSPCRGRGKNVIFCVRGCSKPNPFISYFKWTASFADSTAATSSTSVVDNATIDCRHDLQLTTAPSKVKTYPGVDLQPTRSHV
ncbi:hypothetical protein L6452_19946 [Arctium lappa]|uniref:Uncharacterized protein n=1 Tax=Arctium lappa TaxID=4217 RepID=A0ACB9BBA1_ARCLA|nr:hypothetical protein L6452_19946 [Arctium lappa]